MAKSRQCEWGCPLAGFPLAETREGLGFEAKDTLIAIGRLTGFTDATTCPHFYRRLKWVVRAATARLYRDKGELDTVEQKPVSAVLLEAMQCIDAGFAERQEHEIEAMREKREQMERDATERRNRG